MALRDSERNAIADFEKARLVALSLHTGYPATSANEATGGGYARKTLVWGAAAAGTATAGSLTFDAAAGTYTSVGYWSALTAGTLLGDDDLDASVTISPAGQVTVSSVTLPVTSPED